MTSTPLPLHADRPLRAISATHARAKRREEALAMAGPIAAAALVCLLAVVAITTSRSAGLVACLWAAAGVAVVAWLRGPKIANFDLIFAGVLAVAYGVANLLVGNDLPTSMMFTTANMIEVTLAVLLIRRFCSDTYFRTVDGFARFMLFGAIVPAAVSGLFAAGALSVVRGDDFRAMFETWWFGHALGMAVIAPTGLAFRRRHLLMLRSPRKVAEAVFLLGLTGATGLAVFSQSTLPVTFVIVPALILTAVRLRAPLTGVALVMLSLISIGSAMLGQGPLHAMFPEATAGEEVRIAQLYMIMGALPALLVAVILEERDGLAELARQGQARAERASEGKSRLLANVSHEIKSPIGGVIGIAELWRSGQLGPVSQTQAEMSEMLIKTARQIESLAHDLLDVSRAEAGAVSVDMRPVDVGALLEDVKRAAALMPEAKSVRLEIDRPAERLLALADSQRLSQVMTNLAVNAIKYGGSGGLVVFQAASIGHGQVRLTVVDRGPGLSEEKQAELFEPFNRLGMERSTVEGHGIGLALAKRLVELQQGRIGVVSRPGEGAAFWVELQAA
ncbi:sensor histidine kinase [Brevundimonas sp.]|uniref:sensor histidine kinase n=1 Tax=Brevundimonas sp. TaxID=1871086 RepID=UPI0025F28BED|nr:sensor histidine kinase [Brevundimonas sp.]